MMIMIPSTKVVTIVVTLVFNLVVVCCCTTLVNLRRNLSYGD